MGNEKPFDVRDEWKKMSESQLREMAFGMYDRGEDMIDVVEYIHKRFGRQVDSAAFVDKTKRPVIARVNIGTYPVKLAREMADEMRNAKKEQQFYPESVVLRGRGSRKKYGNQAGIGLNHATGAAMYIDVDVTSACKFSYFGKELEATKNNLDETSKMLCEAHDKIDQLHDALNVEVNKRLMPSNLRDSFEEFIILRMIMKQPGRIVELMKSGFVGMENQSEIEILVKLETLLRGETLNMRKSFVVED